MLAFALALALTLAAPAPEAIGEGLTAREVAPGTWLTTHDLGFPSHQLLLAMPSGETLLVSTPMTTDATRALLAFAERRLGDRPLVAIVPHFHLDGAGGVSALLEAGATVHGSDLTVRLLAERGDRRRGLTAAFVKDPAARAALLATPLTPPSHVFPLAQGLRLTFGPETVEVIHPGPSHAPDFVAVWFPARKILFGGCMLIDGERPGNLSDADVVGWRRALDRLAPLAADARIVVSGHGHRTDPGLVDQTRRALATVALDRRVAVTVDDLPWVGPRPPPGRTVTSEVGRLVAHLTTRSVPATGFAVGRSGLTEPLALWRDAGLPLADHTFTHPAYSKTSIPDFLADVSKNQAFLKDRLGVDLTGGFFRFPYLDHGHAEDKVAAITAFLEARRMRVAPVSLDTVDYAFAAAYGEAPAAARPRIGALYIDHVDEAAEHFEALSRELYGREIPLVLLVHANGLNADHLGAALDRLAHRGYRFVPLAEALADPAYTEHGNRPPHIPLQGDRNFLNLVALSRGLRAADPTGEARFRDHWRPLIEAATRP